MPGMELTTGSSNAEAFTDGYHLTAYAKGGVVNAPTVFAMSDGLGLMGEAGTEAILPLGRDGSGRLGVYAHGVSDATAPTVIVNVENVSFYVEITACIDAGTGWVNSLSSLVYQ